LVAEDLPELDEPETLLGLEEFAALAPLVGARDRSDTLSRLKKGQKATSAKIAINQTRLDDLI
jgi:hypothetical protein